MEPVLFVIVGYWLSGMRATIYAFVMTTLVAIMVMNVSTACGKSVFRILSIGFFNLNTN